MVMWPITGTRRRGYAICQQRRERFRRLLVMNATIAVGASPSAGFDNWKAYVKANPDFDVARLMRRTTPVLSEAEAEAYSAPFPDARYKAGVRRFPELVMVSPEMEGRAGPSLRRERRIAANIAKLPELLRQT
jgi:haloalkane dehalogenase